MITFPVSQETVLWKFNNFSTTQIFRAIFLEMVIYHKTNFTKNQGGRKFLDFPHCGSKDKNFFAGLSGFFLPSQWQCCCGQGFLEWHPHFQIESRRISENWRVRKRWPLEWHTKGWLFSIDAGKCWRNCSNWRGYKRLETSQRPIPWWSKPKHTWPCCEIGKRSSQIVVRGVDCNNRFCKVRL